MSATDPSTFNRLVAFIPSVGAAANAEVFFNDGIIALYRVIVEPGPAYRFIYVAQNCGTYRDEDLFLAGVSSTEEMDLLAVEGTLDLPSWEVDGCPLPSDLDKFRAAVVPAILATAEAVRLLADARAAEQLRIRKPKQRVKVRLAATTARLHNGPVDQVAAEVVKALNGV